MLCLYLQAPFAACRTFTAGWYRPTATFLTPSAAYGLILNIAGIESRLYEHDPDHDGSAPATLTRKGLPAMRLALGAPRLDAMHSLAESLPTVQAIFQQLHNYPVGASGMPPELTKGTKNNITPVRREFLCNLRSYVCIETDHNVADRIRRGIDGEFNATRYGIPFLGDNHCLIDRLQIVSHQERQPTWWFEAITEATGKRPLPHTTRLTVSINRADMSRTVSNLFSPRPNPEVEIPPSAWIDIQAS